MTKEQYDYYMNAIKNHEFTREMHEEVHQHFVRDLQKFREKKQNEEATSYQFLHWN